MLTPSDRKSKIWSVVRVSSGNFLEMYDFMVFGYYATAIGNAFFPNGDPFVALMLFAVVLMCVFPGIATWFPDAVMGGNTR